MEIEDEIIYDLLNSPLKILIMDALADSSKTATHIGKKNNKARSSVSRAIADLKGLNIVRCNNEWHHRGRFYSLTDDGKEIRKKIKEKFNI